MFDKTFLTSFDILPSTEPIIIADKFQFSQSSDFILMSRYVSAPKSKLRQFLGTGFKNISINRSSVSGTLLIHDLICAIISRTYPLMCLSMFLHFIYHYQEKYTQPVCFFRFLSLNDLDEPSKREQYAKGI